MFSGRYAMRACVRLGAILLLMAAGAGWAAEESLPFGGRDADAAKRAAYWKAFGEQQIKLAGDEMKNATLGEKAAFLTQKMAEKMHEQGMKPNDSYVFGPGGGRLGRAATGGRLDEGTCGDIEAAQRAMLAGAGVPPERIVSFVVDKGDIQTSVFMTGPMTIADVNVNHIGLGVLEEGKTTPTMLDLWRQGSESGSFDPSAWKKKTIGEPLKDWTDWGQESGYERVKWQEGAVPMAKDISSYAEKGFEEERSFKESVDWLNREYEALLKEQGAEVASRAWEDIRDIPQEDLAGEIIPVVDRYLEEVLGADFEDERDEMRTRVLKELNERQKVKREMEQQESGDVPVQPVENELLGEVDSTQTDAFSELWGKKLAGRQLERETDNADRLREAEESSAALLSDWWDAGVDWFAEGEETYRSVLDWFSSNLQGKWDAESQSAVAGWSAVAQERASAGDAEIERMRVEADRQYANFRYALNRMVTDSESALAAAQYERENSWGAWFQSLALNTLGAAAGGFGGGFGGRLGSGIMEKELSRESDREKEKNDESAADTAVTSGGGTVSGGAITRQKRGSKKRSALSAKQKRKASAKPKSGVATRKPMPIKTQTSSPPPPPPPPAPVCNHTWVSKQLYCGGPFTPFQCEKCGAYW